MTISFSHSFGSSAHSGRVGSLHQTSSKYIQSPRSFPSCPLRCLYSTLYSFTLLHSFILSIEFHSHRVASPSFKVALPPVKMADPLVKWLLPTAANGLSLGQIIHSPNVSRSFCAFNRDIAAFTAHHYPFIMIILCQRTLCFSLYRGISPSPTASAASFSNIEVTSTARDN